MKPIVTLYLLLNEEDYRLVHTKDDRLAEITHSKAELTAAGVEHVTGHSPREAKERADLAKHVAEVLSAEWGKGGYDRIVIAAGPKALGAVRPHLGRDVQAHIATELHKDLLKVPLHDLPGHFAEVSAV